MAFPRSGQAALTRVWPTVCLRDHLFGDRDPLQYYTGSDSPSPRNVCRQNGVCQDSMSPLHLTSDPLLLVFPFYYSSSLFLWFPLWFPLPTRTFFR